MIGVEELNNKADKNAIGITKGKEGNISDLNNLPTGISNINIIKDFTKNAPVNEDSTWSVEVIDYNNLRIQTAIRLDNPVIRYTRRKAGNNWNLWEIL